MPNNYRKGATFERRCLHGMAHVKGYQCRTAGSHGAFDLVKVMHSMTVLIQCKVGAKPSPATIQRYREQWLADGGIGTAVLVWAPTPSAPVQLFPLGGRDADIIGNVLGVDGW